MTWTILLHATTGLAGHHFQGQGQNNHKRSDDDGNHVLQLVVQADLLC